MEYGKIHLAIYWIIICYFNITRIHYTCKCLILSECRVEPMIEDPNGHWLPLLNDSVDAELHYLRKIGSSNNLLYACGNLGAFEALLNIIKNREKGVPVYEAVASVSTAFTGNAGILNRLKHLRKLELLDEKSGEKKSQVCLVPTEKLLQEIGPILCDRYRGIFHK